METTTIKTNVWARNEVWVLVSLMTVLVGVTGVMPLTNFNNQFIAGPAVNAALIVGAVRLSKLWGILPIVFLPSVSATVLNLFFAVGNQFMLMMIPAIWVGNLLLVLSFWIITNKEQGTRNRKQLIRFIVAAVIGIGLKVGVIFGTYFALVQFNAIPYGSPVAIAMWTMMGVNQLITASIGAVIAFGVICVIPENRPTVISS